MGCRRVAPADELVRVVRDPAGTLRVGRTLPGRGAWLCRGSAHCLALARKTNAFARAFRAPIASDEQVGGSAIGLDPIDFVPPERPARD